MKMMLAAHTKVENKSVWLIVQGDWVAVGCMKLCQTTINIQSDEVTQYCDTHCKHFCSSMVVHRTRLKNSHRVCVGAWDEEGDDAVSPVKLKKCLLRSLVLVHSLVEELGDPSESFTVALPFKH